eukprot:CAMPEP_0119317038 /NCGR_PEP_ID=MMETSP1333-20130426/41708_1 /TAXON_ID=418940 /ORGANISM="Scyphosphaera apsteinii, Strain RCC1455" /LENGTH=536 /DNA_ID=CAMNT_0007322853 /DNA_START=17 /DNA_END=1627 /DNA_ORIENTATION=+
MSGDRGLGDDRPPQKILVAGDVRGQFDALFTRVTTLNNKHGFRCLLCVGNFLGDADAADAALAPYRSGEHAVPLPTYFLAPTADTNALPPLLASIQDGGEISPGIFYLGQAGIKQIQGLQLGYISGGIGTDDTLPVDGLAKLRHHAKTQGFRGVDVLLTNAWPRGCFRQLDETSLSADLLPERDLHNVGIETLAEMAVVLRARYHFCGNENQFWQRPPYRLPRAGLDTHLCRMVALAAVQPDKKQRWLHALSLVPVAHSRGAPQPAEPADTTNCPYPYANTLAASSGTGVGTSEQHVQKKQRTEFVKDPRSWVAQQCWFCMSSPKFESQLVASISDEAYVAIAKGPLVQLHALVLPITHKANSLELSEAERKDVEAYVAGLRRCFSARGQQLVRFERFVGNSQFEHMHLQLVPVPNEAAMSTQQIIERLGANVGITFELLPKGTQLASKFNKPEPFLYFELPSGEGLLHRHASNPRKHPLQFAREAVATVLGTPRKADWKICMPCPVPGATVAEQEQMMADELKAAFASFDPTLTQ